MSALVDEKAMTGTVVMMLNGVPWSEVPDATKQAEFAKMVMERDVLMGARSAAEVSMLKVTHDLAAERNARWRDTTTLEARLHAERINHWAWRGVAVAFALAAGISFAIGVYVGARHLAIPVPVQPTYRNIEEPGPRST